MLQINTLRKDPEPMSGQFLLNISKTTTILLVPKTTVPKTLSSSMLFLLSYLRARSIGGSGGTVAVLVGLYCTQTLVLLNVTPLILPSCSVTWWRRQGGSVGWPVFSLRPIHAMSPQGSPNLVLPSIVQVGGICSMYAYICMRAVVCT